MTDEYWFLQIGTIRLRMDNGRNSSGRLNMLFAPLSGLRGTDDRCVLKELQIPLLLLTVLLLAQIVLSNFV
jgi:hypothetical protein